MFRVMCTSREGLFGCILMFNELYFLGLSRKLCWSDIYGHDVRFLAFFIVNTITVSTDAHSHCTVKF